MTLAVLCPGQGAQHPALFDFVDQFPESARVLAAAADALGDDPRGWLTQGDAIYRNATAQPLITIAQLAQWTALRTRVPEPAALAGYSVGELSCYGIGGALDADELPRLARERADAMDAAADANPGALIGVHGLTRAALQGLCEATASYIAIVIAIDTFVVGGSEAALTGVRRRKSHRASRWNRVAHAAAGCGSRGIQTRARGIGVVGGVNSYRRRRRRGTRFDTGPRDRDVIDANFADDRVGALPRRASRARLPRVHRALPGPRALPDGARALRRRRGAVGR